MKYIRFSAVVKRSKQFINITIVLLLRLTVPLFTHYRLWQELVEVNPKSEVEIIPLLACIILRFIEISGSIPPPPVISGGSLDDPPNIIGGSFEEITKLRDSTD